jgi:hypothetical protein
LITFSKRAPTCAKALIFAALCLVSILALAPTSALADKGEANDWDIRLQAELPLLGHRNWIAVVDSAYPLKTVLAKIAQAKHVRPVIFTDAELKTVPETDAAGVTGYREALTHLVANTEAQSLPHAEIISKLDEAGKTFRILVLKTTLTIPYTSVFIRLECAYWTPDAEKRLRRALASH